MSERRATGVADDSTLLVWLTIQRRPGITRDELVECVGPRTNIGHAKRRYLVHLTKEHRRRLHQNSGVTGPAPEFESLDPAKARRFYITDMLAGMRRDGSVERDEHGGYRVLRKPRAGRHIVNAEVLDVTGEITRQHMRKMDAIRVLKAADARFAGKSRKVLTDREHRALSTLLDALAADNDSDNSRPASD